MPNKWYEVYKLLIDQYNAVLAAYSSGTDNRILFANEVTMVDGKTYWVQTQKPVYLPGGKVQI